MRKTATENDSTKPIDEAAEPEPLSVKPPKSLSKRAREKMDNWFATLSYKDKRKLYGLASSLVGTNDRILTLFVL